MTNGDMIRSMTNEQLVEFFEKAFNQDRDDWESLGCYHCCYYGTHHQENGGCNGCEWENGINGWLEIETTK